MSMDWNTDYERRDRTTTRLLAVADWNVNPAAVVAALQPQADGQVRTFGLIVPAWLHGVEWAGDPFASVPCARRQLLRIRSLADAGGLRFDFADVGDPEPVAAIGDTLAEWPADELVLFTKPKKLRVGHPLDLVHRARRLTGLEVRHIAVPGVPTARTAGRRSGLRRRQCDAGSTAAAT
jgi:hypothetical protein